MAPDSVNHTKMPSGTHISPLILFSPLSLPLSLSLARYIYLYIYSGKIST